jgi:hypothetical protein
MRDCASTRSNQTTTRSTCARQRPRYESKVRTLECSLQRERWRFVVLVHAKALQGDSSLSYYSYVASEGKKIKE